jgi:hypothetical protein
VYVVVSHVVSEMQLLRANAEAQAFALQGMERERAMAEQLLQRERAMGEQLLQSKEELLQWETSTRERAMAAAGIYIEPEQHAAQTSRKLKHAFLSTARKLDVFFQQHGQLLQ